MAFLQLVTEAAFAGLRSLAALRDAAAAGAELAAKQDSRSKLPDAITQLIQEPAVSASTLAKQLQITPQAALRILSRLVEAGIATELTGRKSFRAFAVAYGR
jgi:DNA-binding MarR family transcriptional regulator